MVINVDNQSLIQFKSESTHIHSIFGYNEKDQVGNQIITIELNNVTKMIGILYKKLIHAFGKMNQQLKIRNDQSVNIIVELNIKATNQH